MAKKNGNKSWIAGAILGAVAGAAYALWKTPMSGQELRSKLSTGPVGQRDEVRTDEVHTPTAGDTILGKVEQTLAPIVGVKLGKTANGPAPTNGTVTEPISVATPSAEPAAAEAHAGQAPVAQAAPVEAAAEVAPTQPAGRDTIRAQRFAWGSPAPEATAAAPADSVPEVPVETVAEPVSLEPVQAAEPEVTAATQEAAPSIAGGRDTIRAQRFSWGEPAPEAVAAQEGIKSPPPGIPPSDYPKKEFAAMSTSQPDLTGSGTASIRAQRLAGGSQEGETESELATMTSVTDRKVEAVSDAAVKPGSNMRSFPKLGGLEK